MLLSNAGAWNSPPLAIVANLAENPVPAPILMGAYADTVLEKPEVANLLFC